VLKDRLYTTAPQSLARRSAQTALWQILYAMLHLMAPFLSFTAEEAWAVLGAEGKTPLACKDSIFLDTYTPLATPDAALLAKWGRIRELRDAVNKDIEVLRAEGQVGSSLQAEVVLTVAEADHALLASLGDDLKFVFITSAIKIEAGLTWYVRASASKGIKCERCWHYTDDIGLNPAHPTICGRCVSNLSGTGEVRTIA
jgi:isoleucyl-tRNA synthetase